MGLELAVFDGEFPSLPPIKTTTAAAAAAAAGPHVDIKQGEGNDCSNSNSNSDSDQNCVTPKSEEHVLKPASACPPAPRKRRQPLLAKRKLRPLPPHRQDFCPVPHDLDAVFVALRRPPSKRIRVR